MSATEWKFVPVEPTREMLVAALKTNGACPIYAAMLDAAPVPPSVESLLENWTPSDQQAFARFRDEHFPGEMSSYAIQSLGSAWKDGQANAQPQAAHLTIPGALEWDGDNGTHGVVGTHGADCAHSESGAAIATLKAIGYTHNGGTHWKPPVGQKPDFDLIDSLRSEIESLHASAETVNEVMVRMRADLAEQTARVRTAAGFDLNAMLGTIKGLEDRLASTEQSRRSFFDLSQDLEKRVVERDALLAKCKSWIEAAREGVLYPVANDFQGVIGHNAEGLGQLSVALLESLSAIAKPAKPKTCIECDQPYCHGVCVERGDQDYDRNQAANGGEQ